MPPAALSPTRMTAFPSAYQSPPKIYILGVTRSGKVFRPSDWAGALGLSVMSQFRPAARHWGVTTVLALVHSQRNWVGQCVIVHPDLRDMT